MIQIFSMLLILCTQIARKLALNLRRDACASKVFGVSILEICLLYNNYGCISIKYCIKLRRVPIPVPKNNN